MKKDRRTAPTFEVIKGRMFMHQNGKVYVVVDVDGCFYDSDGPIYGWFAARAVRDGKPFGPMRDMKVASISTWLNSPK